MRRAWTIGVLVLGLAACTAAPDDTDKGSVDTDTVVDSDTDVDSDTVPGETDTDMADTDVVDTDTDTDTLTPDDDGFFDAGDSVPPVYTDVTPLLPQTRFQFQGQPVVMAFPDPLVAVAFVFHGTGGDADVASSTEMLRVLNELTARGIGFVAGTSDNRAAKTWNVQTGLGSNPDWAYWQALRARLIDDGHFTDTTPLIGLGYSNGGNFAGYFAHACDDAGWPLVAISLHQSTGRCAAFGEPPRLPAAFQPAEHDETVDPASVQEAYDHHRADGGTARIWPILEERLAPTRWVRSGSITVRQSQDLWQLAVDEGYYDAMGYRQFPESEIEARVEAFSALPDVQYPRPTKAVLNVVLATHAINGQNGADEARWLAGLIP